MNRGQKVKNGGYQKFVGGVTMMKMKLWTVLLLILCAAGIAQAVDVINVDLNGYNDDKPYVGNGPYNVGNDAVWTVYYGGWGEPIGSSRSEGLVNSGVWAAFHYASVYAAQTWIGDPGIEGVRTYKYGTGLMDDGFVAVPGQEPNLALFGRGAYQGIYDIYVLGSAAGTFRLGYYGTVTSKDVNGTAPAGTFVEGGNYVIFPNVDINDQYSGNIYIAYTGTINGLQFVKKKDPVSVSNGTKIKLGNWDVAGEKNTAGGETQVFGPDVYSDGNTADANRIVGYVEPQEFMTYDITVDEISAGDYNICVEVNCAGQYGLTNLCIFVDDRYIGSVKHSNPNPPYPDDTNFVTTNLTKGSHTITWQLPRVDTYGTNLLAFKFTRVGNVVINNCADVAKYDLLYTGDLTKNCVEDIYDLDQMANNWLIKQ
jgi:hypothetical protein